MTIINKKIGRLTVLEKTNKKSREDILYKCECECGNIAYRTKHVLESSHARSCGCLQRDEAKKQVKYLNDENIRLRTSLNKKPNKGNSTGFKGVSTYRQSNRTKYKASLNYKGKTYQKKGFATAEEAYEYRLYLEEKYIKNKPNLN